MQLNLQASCKSFNAYRDSIEAGDLTCITRLHWDAEWLEGMGAARRLRELNRGRTEAVRQLEAIDADRTKATRKLRERAQEAMSLGESVKSLSKTVDTNTREAVRRLVELGERSDSFLVRSLLGQLGGLEDVAAAGEAVAAGSGGGAEERHDTVLDGMAERHRAVTRALKALANVDDEMLARRLDQNGEGSS